MSIASPDVEERLPAGRLVAVRRLTGRAVDPASLFPEPKGKPFSWRAYGLLTLAIAAASAVSLSRSRGPGALNSVWIEDAHVYLTEAYIDPPLVNLFEPLFGYYQLGPRVLAELAALAPLWLAAPFLALSAALITSGFAAIAYVASGQFFSRWWLRMLVAAPVVLLPLGRTQADNDVSTLHFAGLYALFWILLWRPVHWTGKATAVAAVGFVTVSSILPILFIPLVLFRLFAVRDWPTRSVAIAYGLGMALQISGLLFGGATREGTCCPRYDPVWVIDEYLTKGIPRTLLGEKWLGGPGVDGSGFPQPLNVPHLMEHRLLIIVSWLLVLVVIGFAVRKVTNPHWPLAVTATLFAAVIFAAEITNLGTVHPRYVIAPALLHLTAFAALLRPHDGPGRTDSARPVLMLMVLLAVVSVANFRVDNGRTISRPWNELVAEASDACRSHLNPVHGQFIVYGPWWWRVIIPCRKTN